MLLISMTPFVHLFHDYITFIFIDDSFHHLIAPSAQHQIIRIKGKNQHLCVLIVHNLGYS